jgi:cytochrome c peroxidase
MKLRKTLPSNVSLIGACVIILSLPLLITSCFTVEPVRFSENLNLPERPYYYVNADANLATLGRVLFYDKNLSSNNSVSCSSCHKQELAFADDRKLSLGFKNGLTRRNSMPIQNLSIGDGLPLFWDGRETDLTSMVMRPVTDPVEMGISDMDALCKKLQDIKDYRILFSNAFHSENVYQDRIGAALAAFVQSIQVMTFVDTTFSGLIGDEKAGAELFFTKYQCNSCHRIQDAHGYVQAGTFANIGLEPDYTDNGFSEVSFQTVDEGKFKIPSLRNVALTAPYMHDGRFATLGEVIDHYSEGIQSHPNLDQRLKNPDGTARIFSISATEKQQLIAFLNTLKSQEMMDLKFSDPFVH